MQSENVIVAGTAVNASRCSIGAGALSCTAGSQRREP
jgi:hypothetical protein